MLPTRFALPRRAYLRQNGGGFNDCVWGWWSIKQQEERPSFFQKDGLASFLRGPQR
jgi:hypothetical protein